MPVFRSGEGLAPPWCQMTYFEIVELPAGASHTFARRSPNEKLIVGAGYCRLAFDGQTIVAEKGANLDLASAAGQFEVQETLSATTLIRMCGQWGAERGGSGLFTVTKSADPHDRGDPVDYAKETNFDCHYHDCDEYWIFLQGRGIAVSEGKRYEVKAGDCVATGRGHHHDFPQVFEPVAAVYFETTLEGQKRRGHLWDHTHGPAQPCLDRV
jgi:mannose-6-phosphate isomerase-like protein (cupin superfamily)